MRRSPSRCNVRWELCAPGCIAGANCYARGCICFRAAPKDNVIFHCNTVLLRRLSVNCRKVSHFLSAYIDGELPGVEHRLIHEHLTRCEECRAEQEGLLYTKRMVSRLRLKEPRSE